VAPAGLKELQEFGFIQLTDVDVEHFLKEIHFCVHLQHLKNLGGLHDESFSVVAGNALIYMLREENFLEEGGVVLAVAEGLEGVLSKVVEVCHV